MSASIEPNHAARQAAATLPIRELLERYPRMMQVFDAHGMDMCCGGAHSVPEAAALHELDLPTLLAELVAAQAAQPAR